MNLEKETWSKEDYQEYIEYLKSIAENGYKEFHKKLTPTNYEILGIRVPITRSIAKEIRKGNYKEFLSLVGNNYYEEVSIEGFIIASIKDKQEIIKYMDSFIYKIDNWAICDSFCNSLKTVANYSEEFFLKIQEYLQSEEEFVVRVGLVLLLCFYVKEEYIDIILKLANDLSSEKYYINMALSWLLAECYIKSSERTKKYLEKNNLNSFVQNKTISKICDSYRVTKEEKAYLKTLRK